MAEDNQEVKLEGAVQGHKAKQWSQRLERAEDEDVLAEGKDLDDQLHEAFSAFLYGGSSSTGEAMLHPHQSDVDPGEMVPVEVQEEEGVRHGDEVHDYMAHIEGKEGEVHLVYDADFFPTHDAEYETGKERMRIAYDAENIGGGKTRIRISIVKSPREENALIEYTALFDELLQRVMKRAEDTLAGYGGAAESYARNEAGLAVVNTALEDRKHTDVIMGAAVFAVFNSPARRSALFAHALERAGVKENVRVLMRKALMDRMMINRLGLMEITVDAKSHAEVRFRDPDNGKMVSLKLNEPSPKNLVEAARELMLRYFVARQATEEKEATE